ncbi:helicase with zinc finger domain 2-like [Saccostrea echinata]|uniref:helicase with zinc finger domain 2-like n=1 Tax=Saccostrea echinata TaxID=191078 RepID=UPI002A7FC127|nr:helicase with zinc finger domain 2-like [Saccostrea echinata]
MISKESGGYGKKDNEDETISDNDSNIAMKTLKDIGFRMSSRRELKDFGMDFCREIGLATNKDPHVDALQFGKKNSIEMNIDSSFNGCVNVIQGGKTNKIIIYEIHDNRRGQIQYRSTGRVQVSAVLHSDDPDFQAVTERASQLNIEETNQRPALKDNDTSIQEIRQGSLVITFTFRNEQSLEENIQRVFRCVFEDEKINKILEDQKVDTLEVFGYLYDPKEYFLDYVSKESTPGSAVGKFHLCTHLTWTFSECTCDIDIVLTELFHNLLYYDLTTEVNEDIWIIIKGSIIRPTVMAFTPFESLLAENMYGKKRKINLEFEKSGQCEIQCIKQEKSTTHVVLRTKSCISYSGLLSEDGILLSLLRTFLWSDETELLASKVQLMRIGLILHTKLAQNKETQQSGHTLIIKFCPESNMTKAINNGALAEILTSVLQDSGIEMPERMKIKVDINDQIRTDALIKPSSEKQGQTYDLTSDALSEKLDRAELMLTENKLDEAKQLAREVFDGSQLLDNESVQRLISIFKMCVDDFYSLKCFCKDRVLRKVEWTTSNLATAMEYWMRVIRGPYTFKSIKNLFLEIELLLFEYLKKKEYSASVQGICYELGMAYRHLRANHQDQSNIAEIDHRLNIIDWRICSKLLEEGSYGVVCETYENRAKESQLDGENLYLWAKSLKELKEYETSLEKVEEAILLDCSWVSTSEKTSQELFHLREDLTRLKFQTEKPCKVDENWLKEHKARLKQHQKMKEMQIEKRNEFVRKRQLHKQENYPKGHQSLEREAVTNSTKLKTFEDDPFDKMKRVSKKGKKKYDVTDETEDYNVIDWKEDNNEDSDSGQESPDDTYTQRSRPITYQEKEYFKSEADTNTDSGFDTVDTSDVESLMEHSLTSEKFRKTVDLVISGLKISPNCEAQFEAVSKKRFTYPDELSQEKLKMCERNKEKYKKCYIYIESAHKAICKNVDLNDPIKEVVISGRSKCGHSFTEDLVVVEILGESIRIGNSSYSYSRTAAEGIDTTVYGRVLGMLKRKRVCNRHSSSPIFNSWPYDDDVEEASTFLLRKGIQDIEPDNAFPVFTICGDEDNILEHAFSVHRLDAGTYKIGVHIADLASEIKKNDALDKEARKRGMVYELNGCRTSLIPENLSKEMFSFDLGELRRALTVYFEISLDDKDGIGNEKKHQVSFQKNVVKSVMEYRVSELYDLENGKSKTRHVEDINILKKVSQKLKRQRLGNSVFYTDIEELFQCKGSSITKDEGGFHLIEELLIQANYEIASHVNGFYQDCTPCLKQSPPGKYLIEKWRKGHEDFTEYLLLYLQDCRLNNQQTTSLLKYDFGKIKKTSCIPVQNCVWQSFRKLLESKDYEDFENLFGADEIHPRQAVALDEWMKIQEKEEFICPFGKTDTTHFGLRLPIYTTSTSPMSGFIDLVVQRLLHAILNSEAPPYSREEIETICAEMNEVHDRRQCYRSKRYSLLVGQSLYKKAILFKAFVQNVSENEVDLFFPLLKSLPQSIKRLPLKHLHFHKSPMFHKDTQYDRNIMTIKWHSRIYSLSMKTRNPPKENAYLRLNPHQMIEFQSTRKWMNLLKSVLMNERTNFMPLFNERKIHTYQVPECTDTVNDVCSEVVGGYLKNQICKYSFSINYGQMLRIQLSAEPIRGIMLPVLQLLDITKNVKICMQHIRDPISNFAVHAERHTKEKYESCKKYIETWIPILSMEVSTQTVDGDPIIISDLPVTFKPHGGSFKLKSSYLKKRDIFFYTYPTDMLSSYEGKKKKVEKERFYMSGSDFLCVRCPLPFENGNMTNFGKGAICSSSSYWIAHAKCHDVFKSKKSEMLKVNFLFHSKCKNIPPEILDKKIECNVEILPKSGASRRTELYVKWLESASQLAKSIALRNPTPELDIAHKSEGDIGSLHRCGVSYSITHNKDQETAIKNALTSSFSLIQGPPGTGKTFTGVTLLQLFCKINNTLQDKGAKKNYVVFCGPSNKSVDVVTGYLAKMCGGFLKVLRMYSTAMECQDFPIPGKVFTSKELEQAPDKEIASMTLHHVVRKPRKPYEDRLKSFDKKFKSNKFEHKDIAEYQDCLRNAINEEIPQYDVILCTTSVATSARLLGVIKGSIYQLLIDEAGMCTEPECMAAIIATGAKQVVLIGDHKQLQPIIMSKEAADLGLQKSLFERYANPKLKTLTFLSQQYRMHPNLCSLPSRLFYKNKLETKNPANWKDDNLTMWRNPKYPMVFCHLEGIEEYLSFTTEEGKEMSRFNMMEVAQVVKVFKHMVKRELVPPDKINIVSQYNAQCSKIAQELKREQLPKCPVNTVIASQGGEWDYVIFSLVRSLPHYRIEPNPTKGWCIENLGFITDVHQINVALTRAKKGLIIIGNKELMKCSKELKSLLDDFGSHGCVEDAEKFPPSGRSKRRSSSSHKHAEKLEF